MLFGALLVASVQLAGAYGCFTLARRRGSIGIAAAIVLGFCSFFSIAFLAGGPLQVFHWLALLAVGIACLSFRLRGRSFLAGSLLATVAVLAGVHLFDRREYAQAREAYPFESMTQRLAYETRSAPHDPLAPALDDETRARLDALETRLDDERDFMDRMRTESLQLVHASQVEQFLESEGFGVGRRFSPSVRYLKWDNRIKRRPIPQPAVPPDGLYPSTAGALAANNPVRTKPPSEAELDTVHQEAQLDFVNSGGFGYEKDRDHVAGFVSHAFFDTPELRQAPDQVTWLTGRVELVSILLHDVPMVYVSENLPNMQQLDDVEVRPLDAFETEALDALRQGEDLVWRAATNRLRMLGSLRAARQCTRCHMVPRGTLLGAFSYEFHRDPPLPVEDQVPDTDDAVF